MTKPYPWHITPRNAHTKHDWESMLVVDVGGYYLPAIAGKPIAPARKRWRRLRRLLIQEGKR